MDLYFQSMNTIRPETHEIPEIDIENKAKEKEAEILNNLLKKKTQYANRELERLLGDLERLEKKLNLTGEADSNPTFQSSNHEAAKLNSFLESSAYKSLVQKLEHQKRL